MVRNILVEVFKIKYSRVQIWFNHHALMLMKLYILIYSWFYQLCFLDVLDLVESRKTVFGVSSCGCKGGNEPNLVRSKPFRTNERTNEYSNELEQSNMFRTKEQKYVSKICSKCSNIIEHSNMFDSTFDRNMFNCVSKLIIFF